MVNRKTMTNAGVLALIILLIVFQNQLTQIGTTVVFIGIFWLLIQLCLWVLKDYLMCIDRKDAVISIIGTLGVFLATMYFIVEYLHAEQTIYTWDSCVYWIKAINQEKEAYGNIREMFQTVKTTLSTQEYNNLAAVPLVPFVHYFGATFLKYVFYVFIIYYFPACIFLSLFVVRLVENGKFSSVKYLISLIVITIMPGLFLPLSNGYLDVVGILLISLMLHTTYDWDYKEINANTIIKLCILSLLLLLSRRWYAFFIVGFYFAFGVEFVINEILERRRCGKNWRNIILNMALIATICIIVLLIIAPEIFSLFLGNGYSDAYSAYKTRTFYEDFWDVLKDFGIIFVCIALGGLVTGCYEEFKKSIQRKKIFHLLVATGVTFALFQNVQSMGEHHRYLMLPLFLTLIVYAILRVLKRITNSKGQYLIITGIILVSVINFTNSFTQICNYNSVLLSQIDESPAYRDDVAAVNSIVDYLIEGTENNYKKIYIAVDSAEFSQELLNRSKLPERVEAVPAIIGANIKDTRDGFPSQAYFADYLIVAPTLSNNQIIIKGLTDILVNNDISEQFYELEKVETVTGNVPIYIYRKKAPITKAYVDLLQEQIRAVYPDNEFVNKPNYFIAMVGVEQAKDLMHYSWLGGYELEKGADEDAKIYYQLNSGFSEIDFSITNWYAETQMTIKCDGAIVHQGVISSDGNDEYSFDVTNVNKLEMIISSPTEQRMTLRGELY